MSGTPTGIKPSEFWQQRWWRQPDWALDAEWEHANRLLAESDPDGSAWLFWAYYSLQIDAELARRAERHYKRAQTPFQAAELLDRLKREVDLLSVIGSRYPDVVGRANPWANGRVSIRCPFHADDSPSFSVYVQQQTWWCFGTCNQGGDAIDFVQRSDGLSFVEATLKLAKEFGVAVPAVKLPLHSNGLRRIDA